MYILTVGKGIKRCWKFVVLNQFKSEFTMILLVFADWMENIVSNCRNIFKKSPFVFRMKMRRKISLQEMRKKRMKRAVHGVWNGNTRKRMMMMKTVKVQNEKRRSILFHCKWPRNTFHYPKIHRKEGIFSIFEE